MEVKSPLILRESQGHATAKNKRTKKVQTNTQIPKKKTISKCSKKKKTLKNRARSTKKTKKGSQKKRQCKSKRVGLV